ncbi:MAG TPA: phage portal protein [Coriobacteriia bacterium]|nr:phage portal protein [Coriobacteriia bacterium]
MSLLSRLFPPRVARPAADPVRLQARLDLMQSAMGSLWSWQGGYSGTGWRGDKFSGALSYPSGWSFDHYELRRRARIAKWDSVQARALGDRLETNAVGTGLRLESTPAWGILGERSEEEKQRWTRDVETRWHLWARSKEADSTGRLSLYGLTSLVFRTAFDDGELFPVLRYSADRGRMSPLSIQLVDADAIQQPPKIRKGARIVDGIELNEMGAEIAYHVLDAETAKYTRVPKYGAASGRLFMLHVGAPDRPGEVRAISRLAPIIHELQKLTDYQVAEIEAAVINASFAASIETDPEGDAGSVLQGVVERGSSQAETDAGDTRTAPPSFGWFNKPGIFLERLKKGQKLVAHDTKRPNVNFEQFVKAWLRGLSASLGIPVEVLEMSFNANYSASRASLILFWRTIEKMRAQLAEDFLNPVFEAWLGEEVAAARIMAPGWETPLFRAAWVNCDWIGSPQPNIDPRAEADAAEKNIALGLTTRAREASALNGSDFADNVSRLKVENDALAAAQESLQPPSPEPPIDARVAARFEQLEFALEELRAGHNDIAAGVPS